MSIVQTNHIERSREHLANERTFLAWIRTSIALMGFGFVIVKFGLFLNELSQVLQIQVAVRGTYSGWAGVVMVGIGVLIVLLAFIRYRTTRKQLSQNKYFSSSLLSLITMLILALGGIVLIIYLIRLIDHPV